MGMHKKGFEFGWNELAKLLLAIVVLVVIIGIIIMARSKSGTLLDGLKTLFMASG